MMSEPEDQHDDRTIMTTTPSGGVAGRAGEDDSATLLAREGADPTRVPLDHPTQIITTAGARSAPPTAIPSAAPPSPNEMTASTGSGADPDATKYIRRETERSKIGLVLNGIWEVKRLIARGGMGEVYEGAEVRNPDAMVAIKFLLSDLARDPNIKALFFLEADTLVRLSDKQNPALVQYRARPTDPTLDETYIVMEYIRGGTLGSLLSSLKPKPDDILTFAKLVASALKTAHDANLIHRDISPRNILLQNDDLLRPKVIDFGIAKNLATADKTKTQIGFKGTYSFSAPEQFAESGVGPWTDVYSLALVILAVANGKPIDMGTDFVTAIEKRRKVPDLSAAPKAMRPVLAAMLAPDPAKRLRSMGAVLEELEKLSPAPPKPKSLSKGLVFGGAGAAALSVATAIVWTSQGMRPSGTDDAAATAQLIDTVRQRITAALPNANCSWLKLESVTADGGVAHVKLTGVAGNATEVANTFGQVAGAPASFDTSAVLPVEPQACAPLNAIRPFREQPSVGGPSVEVERSQFAFENDKSFCSTADPRGRRQTRIDVTLRPGDASSDFTLLGLEATGRMQQMIASREEFDATRRKNPNFAASTGGDAYRMSFCVDEVSVRSNPTGLVGLVLVKGKGPFNLGLDPNELDAVAVPDSWPTQFIAKATSQHWTTQMAWYQVIGG